MKSEELNALKKEVESVNEKLRELTEEELEQVTGEITIEELRRRRSPQRRAVRKIKEEDTTIYEIT